VYNYIKTNSAIMKIGNQ